VKIREEMILFKIGMVRDSNFLINEYSLCAILNVLFIQSKIILFLLLNGRVKFSFNCKKHCMLIGISKEDKFRNHPSLTVDKEDDLCEGKESGCMKIKKLGDKLKEGLLTCNVGSS